MTQRFPRGREFRCRADHLILIIAVRAMGALTPPLAGQEAEGTLRPVKALASPSASEQSLELRIQEARESHQRNRLLGSGGGMVGATALLGALVAWVDDDQLGMDTDATGALLAGMTLMVWGGQRRHLAGQALERVELWEAQAGSANARAESGEQP